MRRMEKKQIIFEVSIVGCLILVHAILSLKRYLIGRSSNNGARFKEPMIPSCIQSIKQEYNKIRCPSELAESN